MKGSTILGLTFLLGIGVGVAGSVLLPPAVEPYLHDLLGRTRPVEGRVIRGPLSFPSR
jgi:hypothetical protein